MTFDSLGLSADLLKTVAEEGYTTPTPVQAAAIPLVLAGRDVLAAAQTGTGKTAAFTLPILDRLRPQANTSFSPARHPVRSLILVPTRELAMQVDESVRTYGRTVPLRSTVVYGGIPMDPQIKALRAGVEILVATPGRLLDLVGQKVANLGQVEILVLDEADRMLDMGFLPDIQRIIELLPQAPPEPHVLGHVLRRHPAPVRDDPAGPRDGRGRARATPPSRASASSSIRWIATARRRSSRISSGRATCTRSWSSPARSSPPRGSRRAWTAKASMRSPSTATGRSRSGRVRSRASRPATIRVLVATDVAARGLDIEDLPVVVNFELPWNPQDYIHRIGRTGRAGAQGEAISLVCIDEVDLLRGVQRMLKHAIPWTVAEGFVPDRDTEPRPLGMRSGHARVTQEHHAHRKPVRRRTGAGTGGSR